MSVHPSSARESTIRSVRPIGANGWLISFSVERAETRARHGRARWSLSTGMRRRPVSLK
jgi:hypothetical protein